MKKLLLILLIPFMMGCEKNEYPKYKLVVIDYVPDSLIIEYRQWVLDATSASSFHLSTTKYKNVGEALYDARNVGYNLFGIESEALRISLSQYQYYDIPYCKLTEKQKGIFNSLK